MGYTPGNGTSEFKMTLIINVIAAILTLLAGYGLITADARELWLQLATAVVALVAPLVAAWVSGRYIDGRVRVKEAASYGRPQPVQLVGGSSDGE